MGPIGVSTNGRYFVDGRGRPFFWLGDTQWELARAFTLADVELILENRKHKGFSAIHVMLTGVGDGTRPNLAGESPWVNDDPATPNEIYFRNVDAVLELGHRHGLVIVLGVYHQVQVERIPLAKARGYARWLAQRYKDRPNIIWAMYPRAERAYVPIVRALAEGLGEGDGGSHLISVHPDPSPASSSFVHAEPWLAFNTIQTWRYVDQIYPMVTKDYGRVPTKPVVMAEGAYEEGIEYGFEVTPLWIRRQAYTSCLAGGYHSYGHNDNWRLGPRWKSALDAPGASQMGVLRRVLMARNEWWNLVPDPSVIVDGGEDGPLRPIAARSAGGDWALTYLPTHTTTTIRMDKIASGSTIEASWIDPITGDSTRLGDLANTGARSFSTPRGWKDAVLVLESPTG